MSRSSVVTQQVGLAALAASGYRDVGGRCYRRGDVVLDARGPWWTFRCPAPSLTPEEALERPGLWKIADQVGAVQVCDIPARALGLDAADLTGLLSWVEATRGKEMSGHEPATEESGEIQAVDPQELTARVGPFTCQGKVISEGSRLCVDFPLAALPDDLPEDLSETRQRWLKATLCAARGLAMVRVGRASSSKTIHARVDLTGVPPVWRGPLLTQGTACLRSAVESLLPSITFLTTASVTCRAMELGSLAPTIKEKL